MIYRDVSGKVLVQPDYINQMMQGILAYGIPVSEPNVQILLVEEETENEDWVILRTSCGEYVYPDVKVPAGGWSYDPKIMKAS